MNAFFYSFILLANTVFKKGQNNEIKANEIFEGKRWVHSCPDAVKKYPEYFFNILQPNIQEEQMSVYIIFHPP